jgi:GNAT superfamily N-acetyltransferase
MGIDIGPYEGDRELLRPLFELAEDSRAQLDSYLPLGRVLVARDGGELVGHIQLIGNEIKNIAVREDQQRRGVGALLIDAALAELPAGTRVVVSTAAASIDNLRFYQRAGFRFFAVDRDAFTPATGYPEDIHLHGILLRDRVWFDRIA